MLRCDRCSTEWSDPTVLTNPDRFTMSNGVLSGCPECPHDHSTIQEEVERELMGFKPAIDSETSGYLDVLDD